MCVNNLPKVATQCRDPGIEPDRQTTDRTSCHERDRTTQYGRLKTDLKRVVVYGRVVAEVEWNGSECGVAGAAVCEIDVAGADEIADKDQSVVDIGRVTDNTAS